MRGSPGLRGGVAARARVAERSGVRGHQAVPRAPGLRALGRARDQRGERAGRRCGGSRLRARVEPRQAPRGASLRQVKPSAPRVPGSHRPFPGVVRTPGRRVLRAYHAARDGSGQGAGRRGRRGDRSLAGGRPPRTRLRGRALPARRRRAPRRGRLPPGPRPARPRTARSRRRRGLPPAAARVAAPADRDADGARPRRWTWCSA